MANGRMAIPLDRAPQLAMALGLDVRQFTKAVIKQRYPSVTAVLEHEAEEHSERLSLLQLATGAAGSEPITPDRLRIISEVVRDKRPEERWLAINEIAAVRMLRELRPSGLDHADIGLLRAALEPRSLNAAD